MSLIEFDHLTIDFDYFFIEFVDFYNFEID